MSDEPLDELVEHVDEQGAVLEVVTRGRLRRDVLRHRCVYVFVQRPTGELVLHRRAPWKSIYPHAWDCAFGGICGVGESWADAAARELEEEAGLTSADLEEPGIVSVGSVRYDADDGHIVGRVFHARSSAPLTCPDGEVVELAEVPIDGIDGFLAARDVAVDTVTAALPVIRPVLSGPDR